MYLNVWVKNWDTENKFEIISHLHIRDFSTIFNQKV